MWSFYACVFHRSRSATLHSGTSTFSHRARPAVEKIAMRITLKNIHYVACTAGNRMCVEVTALQRGLWQMDEAFVWGLKQCVARYNALQSAKKERCKWLLSINTTGLQISFSKKRLRNFSFSSHRAAALPASSFASSILRRANMRPQPSLGLASVTEVKLMNDVAAGCQC